QNSEENIDLKRGPGKAGGSRAKLPSALERLKDCDHVIHVFCEKRIRLPQCRRQVRALLFRKRVYEVHESRRRSVALKIFFNFPSCYSALQPLVASQNSWPDDYG
ncbi:MAG: hypothetical protein VW547_15400, partial [Alphaproteobacteria bacterium]